MITRLFFKIQFRMRQVRYITAAFILFLFSASFLFSQDSVSSPYRWQAIIF